MDTLKVELAEGNWQFLEEHGFTFKTPPSCDCGSIPYRHTHYAGPPWYEIDVSGEEIFEED